MGVTTSFPNRRLLVGLAAAYSVLASALTSSAALASLRKTVPMSDTVTSLHTSFFGWGLIALCATPAITARVSRSRLFLLGVLMTSTGAIPFALATNVAMSLGGTALIGFGAALLVMVIPAIVAQHFPANRAVVFARLNAVPVLSGLSLPAVLVAFDRAGWSWRIPVLVAAPVAGLVCLWVALPLIRSGRLDPAGHPGESIQPGATEAAPVQRPNAQQLLRSKAIRSRFILQVIAVALEFGFGSWVVVYLRDEGGLSAGSAPIGAVAWGVGLLSVRVATAKLQAAFGHHLEAVSFAVFAAALVAMSLVSQPGAMLVCVVFAAASVGHVYSLGVDRLYVTAEHAGFHDHDAVSALAALASGLAIVTGPLVIGVLADALDLRRAMLAPALGGAVCTVLALRRWGHEAGQLGRIVHHPAT